MVVFSRTTISWLALYVLALALVAMALVQARWHAMSKLGTVEAQVNWRDWRAEASRQSEGGGPVSRRVPRSEQHPELVMLRDYFLVSFLGLALLTTALFVSMAFMIRGVLGGRRFVPATEEGSPPSNSESGTRGPA